MKNTAPRLQLPRKGRRHFFLLSLLAAAAAAFLFIDTALAQEGPQPGYVDLVMLHEYLTGGDQSDVRYIVRNNGTATATGVSVSFLLDDLQLKDTDTKRYSATKNRRHPDFLQERLVPFHRDQALTVGQFSTFSPLRSHTCYYTLAGPGRSHKRHGFLP